DRPAGCSSSRTWPVPGRRPDSPGSGPRAQGVEQQCKFYLKSKTARPFIPTGSTRETQKKPLSNLFSANLCEFSAPPRPVRFKDDVEAMRQRWNLSASTKKRTGRGGAENSQRFAEKSFFNFPFVF